MSVLFCHDQRFIVGPDGAVYSRGQFSEATVARYERGFGRLFIAARTMPTPDPFDPSRANLVFPDTSRFLELPSLSSVRGILLGRPVVQRRLEKAIQAVDAVVIRLPSELGLAAGGVAHRLRKPVLTEVVGCVWDSLTSHGRFGARFYAPLGRRRMRRAVAQSDWTLYVTERFLQRRYPSLGEQANVSNVQLPPPDETVLRRRLERTQGSSGALVLGMVTAMFHRQKRVDVAIRALAQAVYAGADLRLEVVGPGETLALERLAARVGVRERVRFVGVLPHGGPIFSFLDSVDVYVQTSFQEGLPRALVEAMSRALPALGSDAGGTNEVLEPEWLHAPGDEAALARQLLQLRSPELRVRLATENFNRAAEFEPTTLETRRTAFWERFCLAHGIASQMRVTA